jgi:hypothetical protein
VHKGFSEQSTSQLTKQSGGGAASPSAVDAAALTIELPLSGLTVIVQTSIASCFCLFDWHFGVNTKPLGL